MQTYLKDCTIYDGSGDKPYKGCILIDGKVIKTVSSGIPSDFQGEIIDCANRIATPGFIDCHSHNDWFALSKERDLYFRPFIAQGVTTFVTGNCGFSAAGYSPETPYLDKMGGGLFHLDVPGGKIPSFRQWFGEVDKGCAANVASLVGHGTARTGVNGMKNMPLSVEKEEEMLAVMEAALQEGACGISLGLMYEPGLYAPNSELVKVARLCAKYGKLLTVHPRAESTMSLAYKKITRSHLLLALDELDRIVRETGVRLQYSHLIFVGRRTWKDVDKALEILEKLKSDGYEAMFDMYPLNYGTSIITVVLPDWYRAMPPEKRKNPLVKLKLALMIKATTMILGFNFNDMTIAYAGEGLRDIIGKNVAEIADESKESPFDKYLDICAKSGYRARVNLGSYQNKQIATRLMQHEQSLYMSDAWVEKEGMQNGGVYGAFTRFLELAADSGYPLEKAIAKMTGSSAKRFSLQGRGFIREGYYADINIIEPERLKSRIEECLPPTGMEYVFINGKMVMSRGSLDDTLPAPGMAIRIY